MIRNKQGKFPYVYNNQAVWEEQCRVAAARWRSILTDEIKCMCPMALNPANKQDLELYIWNYIQHEMTLLFGARFQPRKCCNLCVR